MKGAHQFHADETHHSQAKIQRVNESGGMVAVVMQDGDERATQGRAGHGGELECAAIPGDGAGELGSRDQAGEIGGVCGPEKGSRYCRGEQTRVHAWHGRVLPGNQGQPDARARAHKQGHKDDALAVDIVSHVAGGQCAHDHGDHLRQAHQAQRQWQNACAGIFPSPQ